MKTFPEFWDFIEKENPQWWEWTKMRFFEKNIKQCAMDCWAYLLADENLLKMEGPQLRKYFTSWLMKAPNAPVKPQLQQEEEVKVETDPEKLPIPKSDPRYQQHLDNWLKSLNQVSDSFRAPSMSKREVVEQGGWEPKKEEVHQNGIDKNLMQLKNAIKKFANKRYKGQYTFSDFKNYKFGLVDVFAANETDAKAILKKAERYCTMRKIFV